MATGRNFAIRLYCLIASKPVGQYLPWGLDPTQLDSNLARLLASRRNGLIYQHVSVNSFDLIKFIYDGNAYCAVDYLFGCANGAALWKNVTDK